MYAGTLISGTELRQTLSGRHGWIQVASGEIAVDGEPLRAGDGVAIGDQDSVKIGAVTDAEVLLFDLG